MPDALLRAGSAAGLFAGWPTWLERGGWRARPVRRWPACSIRWPWPSAGRGPAADGRRRARRSASDREGDGRAARSAASAWAICWAVDRSSSCSTGRSAGAVCSAACVLAGGRCALGRSPRPGRRGGLSRWSPSCTCWRPRCFAGAGVALTVTGRHRWSFAPDRRRLAGCRGWRSRFEAGRAAEVPFGLRVGLGDRGRASGAGAPARAGGLGRLAGGGRGRSGRTGVPEPTRVRSGQEAPPGSRAADAAGAGPAGRVPGRRAAAPAGARGGGASVSRVRWPTTSPACCD